MNEPIASAVDFESRRVYESRQHPGYTAWVSFFPGERGQWYLTCEEVTRLPKPLPQCEPRQWFSLSLPSGGYDKSQYLMEMVILESTDGMSTWRVISREPCRYHHTAGTYGNQIRTRDGRFLRFVGAHYSLSPDAQPNEILYESVDNGKTWRKMPPFVDARFAACPHRLRMLRDGTLVACIPHGPLVKPGTERPMYNMRRLDTFSETQMMLFFSHDQGYTWDGPVPIYGSQYVSETDFVELPGGDLLFINSSIFAHPGRQFVYRCGNRFTPGPLEKVRHLGRDAMVPETVCLTENGILIGCMRNSEYMWSDDLGQSWWRIGDIPVLMGGLDNPQRLECYQPTIAYLGGDRVACAGHYGGDDPLGKVDEYLNLHLFRLEISTRPRKSAQILVERQRDGSARRWLNNYTLTLTCESVPLPDKELEFWYVLRHQPGYDDHDKYSLDERMSMGGTSIRIRTDPEGKARVLLPQMEKVTDIHLHYQFVVRFNAGLADPVYRPVQTPQFVSYALCQQDAPLESIPSG